MPATHLPGVNPEYVECMMGHERPDRNDIPSKGLDFLRERYMKANFGVTAKPKLSDREVVEALLRAKGNNPAKPIRSDALNSEGYGEPHRVTVEESDAGETHQLVDFFARTVLDEAKGMISSKCLGARGHPSPGSKEGVSIAEHN